MSNYSDSDIINFITHYQKSIERNTKAHNDQKVLHCLNKLRKFPIKVKHLEETGIGRTVNALRKEKHEVGEAARALVAKWKNMVVEEESQPSASDESGIEDSNNDMQDDDKFLNKRDYEEKRQYDRYMDKKQQQDKYSSKATEAESRSKSCKSSPKRHTEEKSEIRHNDHKSVKRKLEDDDESDSKQKHKKSKRSHEDKSHHSKHSKHSSSKPDMKAEGSKHTKSSSRDSKSDGPSTLEKSKSHKSSKHKAKDMDKDQEQNHSSSKPKHKENGKDKPREHKQHKSKSDRDRDRESKESKTHVKKEKSKQEKATVKKLTEGIDSGSGASFAEALGMLEPCSSKTVIKYKKVNSPSEERERPREKSYKLDTPPQRKTFEKSPSPIFVPTPPAKQLDPHDLNLSSLLPQITPNYRPLNINYDTWSQKQKHVSEDEALKYVISSKNQRTKVYSGNKCLHGEVPTLFEMCTRILQDNIDALEYTGGVPYLILKPILEKATAEQLFAMEHHNPYLIEDSDELWKLHCQREFRTKRREEMESWREMYMRCLDEREAKLKILTANIKQAQDKSLPVRQTKLAYVDSVVKPPRNVARKQAKNGTAFVGKPAVTPAARLAALATAGSAGQIAVPNPGQRAAFPSGGGSSAMKPKKAPLMQKALALIKSRFRR